MHKRQRGNALFLILIAVALFAALSYAITQSGRGGGASTDKEKNSLIASQILQLGAQYRAAATRMRVGGVKPEDIHLHDPVNNLAPCTNTDGTCLFTPEGGGMVWSAKLNDAFDDPNSSFMGFVEVGEGSLTTGMPPIAMKGIGSAGPDGILAMMPVKRGVCEAINKLMGIAGIPELDNTVAATLPAYIDMNAINGYAAGCIDSTAIGGPGLTIYFAVVEN